MMPPIFTCETQVLKQSFLKQFYDFLPPPHPPPTPKTHFELKPQKKSFKHDNSLFGYVQHNKTCGTGSPILMGGEQVQILKAGQTDTRHTGLVEPLGLLEIHLQSILWELLFWVLSRTSIATIFYMFSEFRLTPDLPQSN